jgi:hypothetical protein
VSRRNRRKKKSHFAKQPGQEQHPPRAPAPSQNKPAKIFPKEILAALDAGRFWYPQDITISMRLRAGALGVEHVAGELQRLTKKLNFRDEHKLASDLLGLIRAMVARLNWLARAGKLGEVPRYHEDWPINYAPDAGPGAFGWQQARELYERLQCGKDSAISRTRRGEQQSMWRELADLGVKSALLAKHNAAEKGIDDKIKNSKKSYHRIDRPYGHTRIESDYYLSQDGQVIIWPDWAEKSKVLPAKFTTETKPKFLPIVKELVRIYLLQDKEAMLKVLNAVSDKRVSEWDSGIFNKKVWPYIDDALDTLASPKRQK